MGKFSICLTVQQFPLSQTWGLAKQAWEPASQAWGCLVDLFVILFFCLSISMLVYPSKQFHMKMVIAMGPSPRFETLMRVFGIMMLMLIMLMMMMLMIISHPWSFPFAFLTLHCNQCLLMNRRTDKIIKIYLYIILVMMMTAPWRTMMITFESSTNCNGGHVRIYSGQWHVW